MLVRLGLLLLASSLAEQSLPAGWTAHVHAGRTYVRARAEPRRAHIVPVLQQGDRRVVVDASDGRLVWERD